MCESEDPVERAEAFFEALAKVRKQVEAAFAEVPPELREPMPEIVDHEGLDTGDAEPIRLSVYLAVTVRGEGTS